MLAGGARSMLGNVDDAGCRERAEGAKKWMEGDYMASTEWEVGIWEVRNWEKKKKAMGGVWNNDWDMYMERKDELRFWWLGRGKWGKRLERDVWGDEGVWGMDRKMVGVKRGPRCWIEKGKSGVEVTIGLL